MAIAVDQNYDRAQRKISTANLGQFAGVDCQLLVEKETHRPIIMDGATVGGHPIAFKSEVDLKADKSEVDLKADKSEVDLKADDSVVVKQITQTLGESVQTQVLTNLGVIAALEELITEYGGTVPTE